MASLCGSNSGTPFVMPLDAEGKVTMYELLPSLKFNFRVGIMYIEQEIYNDIREIPEKFSVKVHNWERRSVDPK